MLRKQLEEQLGVKLADKKQLIRQEVGAAAVARHWTGIGRHAGNTLAVCARMSTAAKLARNFIHCCAGDGFPCQAAAGSGRGARRRW